MKWRIVEERVWEVEAKDREEALKVFKKSEPSPPTEVDVWAEDWWTQERCDKLADVIRDSLEKRLGVCNDNYDWDEFGPWVKKAKKVIKDVLKVDLADSENEDSPSHQGRWGHHHILGNTKVGIWLFEGVDKDEDNMVWSIDLPEDTALKLLVLGGF